MLEIKVTIAIPGLPEAINNLAQTMANAGTVRTTPVTVPAAVAAPEAVVLPDTGTGSAGTESTAEAATAPVQAAVESTPAASTSATVQTSTPASVHAPTPVLDPIPAPAPTPVHAEPVKVEPAAPAQDSAAAKTYTREEIARAGSALVTLGKMQELLALLQRYGVASVAQLSPEQYGAFAADLIALGASL